MAAPAASSGLTLFEVSKSFGPTQVLNKVSLRVAPGEVVALFGANGAGKTTLIRVAAGIARADGGRVLIDGADLAADPSAAKRRVGWVPEQPQVYDDLSPLENLAFFGRLYGMSKGQAAAAAQKRLGELALAHRSLDPCGTLSHGMRQRLSLARALLHDPAVLLLDEPFEGLDARGQAALTAELNSVEGRVKRAVLLATHQVDLGLAVADRVAVIDSGRLVSLHPASDTTTSALLAQLRALGGGPHGK